MLKFWYDPHADPWASVDVMLNRIEPGMPVSVGGPPPAPTAAFEIRGPAPNPMRSDTRVRLAPGAARRVEVRILDVQGRVVRTLLPGAAGRDAQEVVWDARDARGSRVSSGVYLLVVRADSRSVTRRIVVLR